MRKAAKSQCDFCIVLVARKEAECCNAFMWSGSELWDIADQQRVPRLYTQA